MRVAAKAAQEVRAATPLVRHLLGLEGVCFAVLVVAVHHGHRRRDQFVGVLPTDDGFLLGGAEGAEEV